MMGVMMSGEPLNPEAVRYRRRGGAMIWSEWHFGGLLLLAGGRPDYLDHYGVDHGDQATLERWPYYMGGDVDPESAGFVQWAETGTWHEFDSWEEAERWFERNDEGSLRLRRGE